MGLDSVPWYGPHDVAGRQRQMDGMTIGTLARKAGVGVETLRFYERKGLLPEPPRSFSGYRQYPGEAVARVRFIRRAKELGFTLREIRELLELRADETVTCETVRRRATAKIADIERRIRSLEAVRDALARLAADCPASGTADACPILEALEGEIP